MNRTPGHHNFKPLPLVIITSSPSHPPAHQSYPLGSQSRKMTLWCLLLLFFYIGCSVSGFGLQVSLTWLSACVMWTPFSPLNLSDWKRWLLSMLIRTKNYTPVPSLTDIYIDSEHDLAAFALDCECKWAVRYCNQSKQLNVPKCCTFKGNVRVSLV